MKNYESNKKEVLEFQNQINQTNKEIDTIVHELNGSSEWMKLRFWRVFSV
jgi:hypothetical protein